MKNSIVLIIALMVLFSTNSLLGQEKFGIELRGGASFATQDLGDADLKTGLGSEILLDYRFVPGLGLYVGWGYNHFAADQSFAGRNIDFEETGYQFGLEFTQAIGVSDLSFYVRGGGIYNHIEVENEAGDITADSDHGLGWQAGAGLNIGLGNQWYLKPGVKYQSLSRDITIETLTTPVDLTYFSGSIGIVKRF